jgi:hypothetical protein
VTSGRRRRCRRSTATVSVGARTGGARDVPAVRGALSAGYGADNG